MLLWSRAGDFDLDRSDSCAFRHVYPSIASQPKRVDRVRNHGCAKAEIVFRDSISHPVANVVQRLVPNCRATNGLFYGIDAQVHCADLARQFTGNSSLADSGQTAENDQHFLIMELRCDLVRSPGFACSLQRSIGRIVSDFGLANSPYPGVLSNRPPVVAKRLSIARSEQY